MLCRTDGEHEDLLAGVVIAGEVLGCSTLGASRFFPPVTGFVTDPLGQ